MIPRIVIVGAGEAGVTAALTLREAGWTGAIDLFGAEHQAPYERPPLSKFVMTGTDGPVFPAIQSAQRFADYNISYHRGARVTGIDRTARYVTLADGRRKHYDMLLLATGAHPRKLGVPGGHLAMTLRSFDDACALRRHFGAGRQIVVVGGGLIGLEVAASACLSGTAVTVLENAPRVLGRAVPAQIASIISARHAAEGVEILTRVQIRALTGSANQVAVHLDDGRILPANAVVAGIGVNPDTALADTAGLAVDNGIAVDSRLRTSDPNIFAAGDCCCFPHPLYYACRIRLETWRNAQEQGAFVANAMLGSTQAYCAVPWFWSEQYDLCLQVAGISAGNETVIERRVEGVALLLFLLGLDGRVVAAAGVGPLGKVAKDIRLAQMMIAEGMRPDPVALATPAIRLKDLLAA